MADLFSLGSGFDERSSTSKGMFRSFWMAGFEGADHVNSSNCALSMNDSNQHWQRLESDYALLSQFGIRTVRESIGWRITEAQGGEGFKRLRRHAELAARNGIEVIWTLMHYGWPADIELLSSAFVDRVAAFSEKVAGALRTVPGTTRFYQPVNEISFLSWALSSTGLMCHPHGTASLANGRAVKMQLVRAALRACDAIAGIDPAARFIHSDPLIHVVPSSDAPPESGEAVRCQADSAFEAWDMLCGRAEPQLGGSLRHLDIVGMNYYHANQWEIPGGLPLHWHLGDSRRKPLSWLIRSGSATAAQC